MALTRRLARPMLAAVFVNSGIDTLRDPGPRAEMAEPVTDQLAESPAPVPNDADQAVKVNAVVQIVAGGLLAIGRFRRLSAAALAVSLVPATLAGHPFWEEDDPEARAQQQTHFLKNVGLLGGLILAMFDTEGAPSVGWRAKRAARRAGRVASVAAEALPGVGD
ncbi:MAG: DoxX family protein [Actinomycetota bacterium]|nr:DoxX family protein [Actinomycetota bacterium]